MQILIKKLACVTDKLSFQTDWQQKFPGQTVFLFAQEKEISNVFMSGFINLPLSAAEVEES